MKKSFRGIGSVLLFPKIDLKMKLTVFLLVVSLFRIQASTYSQNTKLTLNMNDATMGQVFDRIESESEFRFLFESSQIDLERKTTISVKKKKISDILRILFRGTDIVYTTYDRQITLTKKEASLSKKDVRPIEMAAVQTSVQGTITDADGQPLPGASVIEKGTTNGTQTDFDGNYSITVADDNAVLVVSYIGFATREVNVNGQSTVNISLQEDTAALDEVVVVGYGTQLRESLTGAISEVKSETISKRINTTGIGALQGLLPGLNVTRGSGQIGREDVNFSIRGISSTNDADPLIIIDGVASTNQQFNLINPNDIENVSVLKDAAASIYGSRAANGVVLVTTKRGKGEPKISISSNFTLSIPGLYPRRTTTLQHFEMANEAFENDGDFNSGFAKYKDLPLTNDWVEGPFGDTPAIWFGDFDWKKALWGNAVTQQHNFNVQGATDKSSYSFSAGYLNQESMFKYGNNENERFNLRLNYDYNLTKRLKFGANVAVAFNDIIEPTQLNQALNEQNRQWSTFRVFSNDGNFYNFGGFQSSAGSAELGGDRSIKNTTTNINLNLEYKFGGVLDGLVATTQIGINSVKETNKSFTATYTTSNGALGEGLDPIRTAVRNPNTSLFNRLDETDFQSYVFRLNYDKTFNQVHNVSLLAGASQEENLFQRFEAGRRNALSDELHTLNLGDGNSQTNTGAANHWALRSFFGRAGYVYDGRYSVSGQYRYDGSSRFIGDDRYRGFASISGAWIASNEQFIQDLGIFDNLKFRASYGEAGHQGGIGLYDYIQQIGVDSDLNEPFNRSERPNNDIGIYPFGAAAGSFPSAFLSNSISLTRTWEKITTTNFGVDFAVLDNKLSGSFDYFVKKNTNMLVSVTFPEVLGIDPPQTNNGALETKGWEATLNWRDRVNDNFSYFITAYVTDDKNVLTDLAGADTFGARVQQFREGFATNSIFGYKYDDHIQNEQELAAYQAMPGVSSAIQVGDARFVDVDGNGEFNAFSADGKEGDLVHLGNTNPRYSFSMNFGAQYKAFDFSMRFQGVGKRTTLITGGLQPYRFFWFQPFAFTYNDTWAPDRTNARFPSLSGTFGSARTNWNYQLSDRLLYDAGYIRLSDVQIGFNMTAANQPWLEAMKISSVRLYLNGRDLWEYAPGIPKGFNPETVDPRSGIRANFHTFARYVGMGLDVTF
ncbi:TonB-dependent receptor [Maribacter sp. 2304DJ31-5]|uniref:TonB-dependent receptor n=1 Tax=Maribacter sp. 2304DJ31-5 TaxID=3386273 RepID=UPI0039BC95F2